MKDGLKKLKSNVTISIIDKDNKEKVIRKQHNIFLDRIYNYMLANLSPWPSEDDVDRKQESIGKSLYWIAVGTGHHVTGDVNSPLPPRPEWADPYTCSDCDYESFQYGDGLCPECGGTLSREWDDLETPIAKSVITYFEEPTNKRTILSAVFTSEQANLQDITEAGLYLFNGEMVAINTFRAYKKTREYSLKITWELYFE